MDVTVTRRHIKKDYFESSSGGYFSSGKTYAPERHWECGRLTELAVFEVTHTFSTPFATGTVPVGLGNIKVYKMVLSDSVFIKQDVLHTFPLNLSPHLQFLVNIDSSESLEGVIIEFMFTA